MERNRVCGIRQKVCFAGDSQPSMHLPWGWQVSMASRHSMESGLLSAGPKHGILIASEAGSVPLSLLRCPPELTCPLSDNPGVLERLEGKMNPLGSLS